MSKKYYNKSEPMRKKQLPADSNSTQMDIFRTFLTSVCNKESDYSNLIDFWDRIPKYCISMRMQSLWQKNGLTDVKNYPFSINNKEYQLTLTPALIKDSTGKTKAFFPSSREKIIEQVLRKLLLDQNLGIHTKDPETWVKYSTRMIRRELKAIGKSANGSQIKLSLEILHKSHIDVYEGKKKLYSGSILNESVGNPNSEYDPDDMLYASSLSSMVSRSIQSLSFTQYNYLLANKLNNLANWIFMILNIEFLNAGNDAPAFKLSLSRIKNESLLLDNVFTRKRKSIEKVREALTELVKNYIIVPHAISENKNQPLFKEKITFIKRTKTIDDVVFYLQPTDLFIRSMKASNKRKKQFLEY